MKLDRRIKLLENRISEFQVRLESWRNRRLGTTLIFIVSIVAFNYLKWPWAQAATLLIFLLLFIPMVIATRRISSFLLRLRALCAFYQRQKSRQGGKGVLSPLSAQLLWSKEKLSHPLNRDLNLFSENGFFGLCDEFISEEGRAKAAQSLTETQASIQGVIFTQNMLNELSRYSGYLRRSNVEANVANEKSLQLSNFVKLVMQQGLDSKSVTLMRVCCGLWLLAALSLIALSFGFYGQIAAILWLAFAATSLMALSGGMRLFQLSLSLQGESQTSPLFARWERLAMKPHLRDHFPVLASNQISKSIGSVESLSHFLSTVGHPIIHLLINVLTPWSAFFSLMMEAQRKKLQGVIEEGVNEFSRLDALVSFSYIYSFQTQVFPEFSESFDLEVEQVFHPLLPREQAKANDFAFPNESNQILITGSNMSGKSTFLRTIALNQVLALAGLPVFAKSMKTSFAPVVSCIQVSDSLAEGLSSFYAEVVCLRKLYTQVKEQNLLYFVDEIFRGTNNRERLIGSASFLKELSKYSSKGFVTTHDLELAELESQLPGLSNFHFRDELEDGKMVFPYKIFDGVCPTTNALRIMKAEGLPVQESL